MASINNREPNPPEVEAIRLKIDRASELAKILADAQIAY
jgi:hypothetical protein